MTTYQNDRIGSRIQGKQLGTGDRPHRAPAACPWPLCHQLTCVWHLGSRGGRVLMASELCLRLPPPGQALSVHEAHHGTAITCTTATRLLKLNEQIHMAAIHQAIFAPALGLVWMPSFRAPRLGTCRAPGLPAFPPLVPHASLHCPSLTILAETDQPWEEQGVPCGAQPLRQRL